MKKRDRAFDIFNLSFLDIISCGFGAVIMLILISKPDGREQTMPQPIISTLLNSIIELERNISTTQDDVDSKSDAFDQVAKSNNAIKNLIDKEKGSLKNQEDVKTSLTDDIEGLSLVESTLKRMSIPSSNPKNVERDEEVGGIPVDSDYVIFVIDTSGSMQQIWARVTDEIINVLDIHPEVKGFQVLNDMGKPIVSGYDGKWMPDTESRRKRVVNMLQHWGDISNSSPIEGIEVALKKYAKPNISTSIYVFGDDYTGSSYDPMIDKITKMNTSRTGDKQLAKIHGVGFRSEGTTDRFGILMRELTKRNGGTLLTLPDK